MEGGGRVGARQEMRDERDEELLPLSISLEELFTTPSRLCILLCEAERTSFSLPLSRELALLW